MAHFSINRMNDSMRLRINYIFCQPGMAGGVKSGRLIAEAMVRRGHDVRIIFPSKRRPLPPPWQPRSLSQSIVKRAEEWWKVHRAGRQHHHLEHSTAELIPVNRSCLTAEDIPGGDVCIANFWQTRELIEDWPARTGIKCLYVRGHFPTEHNRKRLEATYHLGGIYMTHARFLVRLLEEEHGVRKVIYAPNGIDRRQFGSEPRGMQTRPTIGFQYGDSHRKGADTMFDAARIVRRELPELRLIAFGSSPLARMHGPPRGFEFHLRPPQSEIPKIFRETDCWVIPSREEGLPMPGLEGAACRCPIVATECGGPEDYIIDRKSGYLVPVDDPGAMAKAILRVLRQPEEEWRRMSEASYARSMEFDWDKSAIELESGLFEALAATDAR